MYRDDLVRIVVDTPDEPSHRQWFSEFKARWEARLEQLDLWLISYQVDIE